MPFEKSSRMQVVGFYALVFGVVVVLLGLASFGSGAGADNPPFEIVKGVVDQDRAADLTFETDDVAVSYLLVPGSRDLIRRGYVDWQVYYDVDEPWQNWRKGEEAIFSKLFRPSGTMRLDGDGMQPVSLPTTMLLPSGLYIAYKTLTFGGGVTSECPTYPGGKWVAVFSK